MTGPGGLQGPPALLQHALGSIVMELFEHPIPPWRCSVLYRGGKNVRQKAEIAAVDVVEAAREAGVVLQGLELGLGEGVVVGHLRAAQ